MSVKRLSKKEIKELNNTGMLFVPLNKKDIVDIVNNEVGIVLKINNRVAYFKYKELWIPTIKYLDEAKINLQNYIIVDKGAVRFVANGADIMRPGIVEINGDFDKDAVILIKEETYKKVIGIGLALLNSEQMKNTKTGKVVKNLHHIGDKIWKLNEE